MPNRQGYDHIGNFNFKGDRQSEAPGADWDKASFPARGEDGEATSWATFPSSVRNGANSGDAAAIDDDGPSTFLSVAAGDVNRDGIKFELSGGTGDADMFDAELDLPDIA